MKLKYRMSVFFMGDFNFRDHKLSEGFVFSGMTYYKQEQLGLPVKP